MEDWHFFSESQTMNYYIFETKFSNRIASPKSETLTYEDYNKISSGKMVRNDLALEFVLDSKKVLCPVLSPASVGFYLFSNSLTERFKEEKILGGTFLPTITKNEKGEPTPIEYSVLSIVQESDETDYTKSISSGDGYISGLHIPGIQDIRADVFRPKNSLHIIVSQKFKKIMDEFKLKNLVFTHLDEFRIPEFIVKNKR